MPELPDVEVFRQYFNATSLHQKIKRVDVRGPRLVHETSAKDFAETLAGHSFESTRRYGKYAFAELDDHRWLVLHFGMTGYLDYFKHPRDDPEYDQVQFAFSNGYHLAYVSKRKLGALQVVEDVEAFIDAEDLGPDVYEDAFDLQTFRDILRNHSGMIKSTLMNQSTMAGIGNIYSDEILFQAGVHPRTRLADLDDDTIRQLHRNLRSVLRTAIHHKADPHELPDTYIIPHRKSDGQCPKCEGELERIEVGGRAGYYCPACQPENQAG